MKRLFLLALVPALAAAQPRGANSGPCSADGSGCGIRTPAGTTLTSGRVPYATTGGALTDSTSFTFAPATGLSVNRLSFSSALMAGLRLNNLTTAQRDALTAAKGDLVFNTETNRIETYDPDGFFTQWPQIAYLADIPIVPVPGVAPNDNTRIGNNALLSGGGQYNTAMGAESMAVSSGMTGIRNSAFGWQSLYSNLGGAENTALGAQALRSSVSGSRNTAVGEYAGYNSGSPASTVNAVTTGADLTFVGYRAGLASSTQYTNSTAIGANAYVNASNTVALGDASVTQVLAGSSSQATFMGAGIQFAGNSSAGLRLKSLGNEPKAGITPDTGDTIYNPNVGTVEVYDGSAWFGLAKTTAFSGASSGSAGSAGLVPAPSAGDQDKYLRANGSWSTVSSVGGSDTQLQFNDGGALSGDSTLAFNKTSKTVTAPRIVSVAQASPGGTGEDPSAFVTGGPNTTALDIKGTTYTATGTPRWLIARKGTQYSDDNGSSRATSSVGFDVSALGWNGSIFLAGGFSGGLKYSSNGVDWTSVSSPPSMSKYYGFAWNGSMWLALGEGTNTMAYSSDGQTWTGLGASIFTMRAYNAAWNGSYWVAVGRGTNDIAKSSDGINWTGYDTTMSWGQGVAWSPELALWIVVGYGTYMSCMKASTDGATWNTVYPPYENSDWSVNRVVWTGSRFVAVGATYYTGTVRAWYSSDGYNWASTARPAGIKTIPYGLAWNGSYAIAAAEYNQYNSGPTLIRSADGVSWEALAYNDIDTASTWQAVISAPSPTLLPGPLAVGAGITTQTAPLQRWKDGGDNVLSYIDKDGKFVGNVTGNVTGSLTGNVTGNVTAAQYINGSSSKGLTESTDTAFLDIALGAGERVSGEVIYEVFASDSTDIQALTGTLRYVAVNKAGAITVTVAEVGDQKTALSTGTLTASNTAVAGTGKITLRCNADSSLTQTSFQIRYRINSVATNTITPL